jgi:hypothetical protein
MAVTEQGGTVNFIGQYTECEEESVVQEKVELNTSMYCNQIYYAI